MTTRRQLLQALTAIPLASALGARVAVAAPEPAKPQPPSVTIDELVESFLQTHHVPALSLAFARPNQLLLAKAWGVSEWGGDAATADSLFRIASVTKPITAVAIFKLIERDLLRLDDRVFGEGGLLDGDFGADLPVELNGIRVRHLLTHTSGGWKNDWRGPTLMHPEMAQREWIEWVLRERPLRFEPGERYVYSNFGYCLLGWIIAKLTARPYADYVRETVLTPCKIGAMQLAKREQAAGEVRYYDGSGQDPYARNMERLEACAGWLATPTDLVRFATRFSDLLKPETLKTMLTPSAANPGVACGWSISERGTVWHSGGIAGSNAFVVRLPNGLHWAALTNSSGKETLGALNELMWKIARGVPEWDA